MTKAWLISFAVNLVQDIVLLSPIHIFFFNFFLVGLVKKKLQSTTDTVCAKLKAANAKLLSNTSFREFNALNFFSGSFRASVLNSEIFGCQIILKLSSDIIHDTTKKKKPFTFNNSMLFLLTLLLLLPESTQVRLSTRLT